MSLASQLNALAIRIGQEIKAVKTAYLLSSAYTASDVLAKIKTVDGAGSGLDADTLDGIQGSEIKRPNNSVTNNLGTPSVEEMALFHGQFSNKLRFLPADLQEQSTDGVIWTTSSRASLDQLKDLMLGEGQTGGFAAIPISAIGGKGYYRLYWYAQGYCSLQSFYLYGSANGNSIDVKIEKYNVADGWTLVASGSIGGWPEHTYIPHDGIWFLANATQLPHHGKVRVTFGITSSNYANNFDINAIEWFGGYPAGRRNMEWYDRDQNVYFPAGINSNGALKQSGTQVILEGDSRLSNARPASDVSVWAKAGSKPGYNAGEIGLGNVSNAAQVTTAYNSSLNSDTRNSRGVTRLYRNESDSDYSVQIYWTGTHWLLQGYNGDTFHAGVRVLYADTAGSSPASDVSAWAKVGSKPSYSASEISQDASNRFITDAERTAWNANIATITKAMVEAVLTGNISTHYHAIYLQSINRGMVEAVLTGEVTTHQHDLRYLMGINKSMVESVLTGVISTHTHAYEAAFSKNSAFNKNFGSASGDVCQGNDSRLADQRTPTDTSITYAKVANNLKTSASVSSTVDLSANGIGKIILSGNTAFTFTGFELNKSFLLIITANGYTPSFAVGAKHLPVVGNIAFDTTSIFYVNLTCIDATSGSEKLLTTVMKGA